MLIIRKIRAQIHNFQNFKKELKNTLSWKNIKKVVKEKINILFEKHPFIHKMAIGAQVFVLAYGAEAFFRTGDSIAGTEGFISMFAKFGAYYCALFCIFYIGTVVFNFSKTNAQTDTQIVGETANE